MERILLTEPFHPVESWPFFERSSVSAFIRLSLRITIGPPLEHSKTPQQNDLLQNKERVAQKQRTGGRIGKEANPFEKI